MGQPEEGGNMPKPILITLVTLLYTLGGQWIALPIVIAYLANQGLLAHAGPLATTFSVAQLAASLVLFVFFEQKASSKEAEVFLVKRLAMATTLLSGIANVLLLAAQLDQIGFYYIGIFAHGVLSSAFATFTGFLTRTLSKNHAKGYSRTLAIKTPLSAMATYVAFMISLIHGVVISTLCFIFSLIVLHRIKIEQPKESEKAELKKEVASPPLVMSNLVLPVILALAGMGTMMGQVAGNQMLPLFFEPSTAGLIMSATTLGAGFLQYIITQFEGKGWGNALSILLIRGFQVCGLLFFLQESWWFGALFWVVAATHNTMLGHAIHERTGARLRGSVLLNISWQISGALAGGLLWMTNTSSKTFYWLILISSLSTVLAVALWPYHKLKKTDSQ